MRIGAVLVWQHYFHSIWAAMTCGRRRTATLVAREMMDSGDYLHPRVNNQPIRKTAAVILVYCACSSLTGEVTPWSARVPSVVSGLVVLLFTALLARELFNARIALWSVLILMTMQRFWWNSRFGQIDMLLAACLTAGLYGYWRYEKTQKWGVLACFYVAVLAGLFAKGPGVLVFPTLFILVWTWRAPQRTRAWAHLVLGCSLCIMVYALWVVPTHITFAREAQEVAGDALPPICSARHWADSFWASVVQTGPGII